MSKSLSCSQSTERSRISSSRLASVSRIILRALTIKNAVAITMPTPTPKRRVATKSGGLMRSGGLVMSAGPRPICAAQAPFDLPLGRAIPERGPAKLGCSMHSELTEHRQHRKTWTIRVLLIEKFPWAHTRGDMSVPGLWRKKSPLSGKNALSNRAENGNLACNYPQQKTVCSVCVCTHRSAPVVRPEPGSQQEQNKLGVIQRGGGRY